MGPCYRFAISQLFLVLYVPFITVYVAGVGNDSATFSILNGCKETIWPAVSSSEDFPGIGFALKPGESRLIVTPQSWAGRIWARNHCFTSPAGRFRCLAGDCGAGTPECTAESGDLPITVAEFLFNYNNLGVETKYDVSLVEGFNIPILVTPIGNECRVVGCAADLIGSCPEELKMTDAVGNILACRDPCDVFKEEEYCCTVSGTHGCKPTNYSNVFKKACPDSYTYRYDSVNSNISFSCLTSGFTITFCPSSRNVDATSSQVPRTVNATSMLKPGDELNFTSHLVSQGGTFTLGFFTIRDTNLSYIGIWYTADEHQRKVWVANPNSPITVSNNDAQLAMDGTGNVRLFSGGNLVTSIAVEAVTSNNTIAVLLESGNFVLTNSGAGNQTLWQSFDHPTDTLLPGMKLGFNLTTRQNWTLVSWLSDDIASSGAFTMSLERTPDSGEFIIRRRGEAYWTSGSWNKKGFPLLSLVNEKPDFMSTDDGMYFTFQTSSSGTLAMLTLSLDGTIVDGENRSITPFPTFCYGYEKDNGCVTSTFAHCRNDTSTFEMKTGSFVGGAVQCDENSTITLSDCMDKCWNYCSCNGFASSNINGTGCITWTNSRMFQVNQSSSAVTTYVLVANKTSKGRVWIWIIISVSVAIMLLLIGIVCLIKINRRKAKDKRLREGYIHQLTQSDSLINVGETQNVSREGELNILSFSSIVAATDDFSAENKLGEGGFGPVYKGKLKDGREVAVKRLSRSSGQGLAEFKNELVLISKLQHTNLVRLLGCCIHEEEKMLIYEYMPNKSLDFFLFDDKEKEQLDWKKRFNIIEGVAQGLLYLHKYSRMRVIHRDVKASNVLLDENMNAKIADFGMARIFKQNETEAVTNRVVGTYGYMSPEYAMEGTFSIKSDVFSFGVLILEIVSGRRNSSFHKIDERSLNLIGQAWEMWRDGRALDLKDPLVGDSYDTNMLLRSVHVGLLCVQESATDRPTTSEVISMLNNERMVLPAPKQPAFFICQSDQNTDSTPSEERGNQGINAPISVNDLTISVIQGR